LKLRYLTFEVLLLTMTDPEITQWIQNPETRERGFLALVKAYQKPIYYFIRRMVLAHDDAADVSQNTFLKAWKALPQFRGDSKLSTWLHTIAYNESISFLTSKHRVGKVTLGHQHHALRTELASDVYYSGDEIQLKLQAALATLPEKQKAVFIMKYYKEMKYEEIAEITGTSVGALKASYHHAVQKVEAFLQTDTSKK
jgi:RNA polymerase sigma-70 factor, ECF subfamily